MRAVGYRKGPMRKVEEDADDRVARYRSQQAERDEFPSGLGHIDALGTDFDGRSRSRKADLEKEGVPETGRSFVPRFFCD